MTNDINFGGVDLTTDGQEEQLMGYFVRSWETRNTPDGRQTWLHNIWLIGSFYNTHITGMSLLAYYCDVYSSD